MLADRIKEEAQKRGLSIAKVEKMAGLSNGVIRHWNTAAPSVYSLQAVARVLGLRLDDLVTEKKRKKAF